MDEERERILKMYDTGKYLHGVRSDKKITITDASKRLGISRPYLSEIEKGSKMPSDELIRTIANIYELDEDDLFSRFGKIPLLAREAFEQLPGLHKTFAEIKANYKMTDDEKQVLYDVTAKLYKDFTEKLAKKKLKEDQEFASEFFTPLPTTLLMSLLTTERSHKESSKETQLSNYEKRLIEEQITAAYKKYINKTHKPWAPR